MSTLPHLAVFDMAGTTVHDEAFVHRAFAEAFVAHTEVDPTFDEVNAVMGYPKRDAVRRILEGRRVNADSELVETIHASFLEGMNKFYQTSDALCEVEGTSDTFRILKQRGVRIALNTGFGKSTADIIIDRLGWRRDGLIDYSITSEDVARGRPHADMIVELMQVAEVTDPADVAKIGDTPSDLLEGSAAGCGYVIGVSNGSHTEEELMPYPHTHIVASVSDVPAVFGLDQ